MARIGLARLHAERLAAEAERCDDPERLSAIGDELEVIRDSMAIREQQLLEELQRATRRLMAVRIRKTGEILCAAMHPEEPGDVYLDDGIHYRLSVELKVLVSEPMERHQHDGLWWWRDEVPDDRAIDPFYERSPA